MVVISSQQHPPTTTALGPPHASCLQTPWGPQHNNTAVLDGACNLFQALPLTSPALCAALVQPPQCGSGPPAYTPPPCSDCPPGMAVDNITSCMHLQLKRPGHGQPGPGGRQRRPPAAAPAAPAAVPRCPWHHPQRPLLPLQSAASVLPADPPGL